MFICLRYFGCFFLISPDVHLQIFLVHCIIPHETRKLSIEIIQITRVGIIKEFLFIQLKL